jgi:hypothetical protein
VVSQGIRQRLVDVAPAATIEFDSALSRVTIRDWKRHASDIESKLAIAGRVQLVWLVSASESDDGERVWLPLAGKLPVKDLATGAQGLGQTVATAMPLFGLDGAMIAGVKKGKTSDASLSIELTAAAREQLSATWPASQNGAMGLVIDGAVEGIATREEVGNKRIRFELCARSGFSVDSIQAAIRGPVLPCELESMTE